MAIGVTCPNGHLLKIKDKYAGKTGFCPMCEGRVRISVPKKLNDDEIIEFIGKSPDVSSETIDDESESVLHEPLVNRRAETSGISLVGASAVRHKKKCPKCSRGVPYWYAKCPHCNSFL